jgi:non-ribosomal peptide synthetase component E (peptide arylation enzyme)
MNGVSKAHQAYHESGWWRDQTFLDDLHHHATQQPGKTAVIGHNTATGQTDKVDYAELSRQTDRMALGLVGLGIRRGEYICVLLPDYWEMLPLVLACIKAGVRIALVPPEYRRSEMEFVFGLTEARLLITATEVFGGHPAQLALELSRDTGLPEQVVVFGDDAPAGALSFAEYFLDGPGRPGDDLAGRLLGPDEPYVLTFTSGTTGTTKALMQSQNTLYAGLRGYAEALGFDHTLVNTAAHSNMYMAGLGVRLLTWTPGTRRLASTRCPAWTRARERCGCEARHSASATTSRTTSMPPNSTKTAGSTPATWSARRRAGRHQDGWPGQGQSTSGSAMRDADPGAVGRRGILW